MLERLLLTLPVPTEFRVTDARDRILCTETLPAGTAPSNRLRLAHRNDPLQGWTVEPLRRGAWSFVAEKGGQQFLIGIRRHRVRQFPRRDATSNTTDRTPTVAGLIRTP